MKPKHYAYGSTKDEPHELDNLCKQFGQAMLNYFDLKERLLVDYVTIGTRKTTNELTIIVRKINGQTEFCTDYDASSVLMQFIECIDALMDNFAETRDMSEDEHPF
jgi:hypothetical protein